MSRDQAIPVVVTALVPHVSEQRPIRLAHRRPPPLALGVVGLGDVDGDDAVGVPGQHRPAARLGIREKLERQPSLRIVDPVRHRQTELDQREQQTPLGGLEAVPRGRGWPDSARLGMTRVIRHDAQSGLSSSAGTAQLQIRFNLVVLTEPVAARGRLRERRAPACRRHRAPASRPAADPAGRRRGGRSSTHSVFSKKSRCPQWSQWKIFIFEGDIY